MTPNNIELLHGDELLCLVNCIINADYYINDPDAPNEQCDQNFQKNIGVNRQFAMSSRRIARKKLHAIPSMYDSAEPWAASPLLSQMSLDVISKLSTEELICFANCIKNTLISLDDDDDDFHTHIGVTVAFAQTFRQALEMQLTKRQT
ncbi:MAG: hypothetical protein COB08_014055 [Rhodobacteraceae bacterium]|nr:hypothetical protein [Paracoccaceae bacterium]